MLIRCQQPTLATLDKLYYVLHNSRMKTIDGNSLRGHLESLILAVLEREAAHGFEIMKQLDEEGRGALSLKEATIYPILYRLEKAKHVRGAWDTDTTSSRGPRRRIYHITPKGRRELTKRRKYWAHFVSTVGRMIEVPQ